MLRITRAQKSALRGYDYVENINFRNVFQSANKLKKYV